MDNLILFSAILDPEAVTCSTLSFLDVTSNLLPDSSILVSTTGHISRELYEIRKSRKGADSIDFLTVGSMGHSSQIALGIAINKTNQNVLCLDGDGSFIMHMGSIAINGDLKLRNFNYSKKKKWLLQCRRWAYIWTVRES